MKRVGLINAGSANIASVRAALERAGAHVLEVDEPHALRDCPALVLPGVGAFPAVMRRLRARGLDAAVRAYIDEDRGPVLGICAGMQVLARAGDEFAPTQGLGVFDARVEPLRPAGDLRVPHMGWNDVAADPTCPLMGPLGDGACFYFVHSFAMTPPRDGAVSAQTDYGGPVVAAVRRGRVFGVQFHPEKSQESGLELLRCFVGLAA